MKTKSILFSLLLMSVNLLAQKNHNWNFEFRSAGSYATQNLGDADLNMGLGFEGNFSYRLMPHLSATLGWGWNKFSAERSFFGSDMNFEETGYTFGLQFLHPINNSGISYLVRGGGIYNHIEIENEKGDITHDSGHGLGWQIETGLAFELNNQLSIIPSIRYRSLSRDIKTDDKNVSIDLNYLSAGIGLSWSF